MKKIFTITVIVILSMASVYFYVAYKSSKKKIDKVIKKKDELVHFFVGELINRSDTFPKTKEDLVPILSNINNSTDNYNYEIEYDETKRSTKIYIKNDKKSNQFFYLKDIKDLSFIDYFKNRNSNIVFLELFEDKWKYDFCSIKDVNDLKNKRFLSQFSDLYKVYKGNYIISKSKLSDFKNFINFIEIQITNKKQTNQNSLTKDKLVFLRFKRNKISVVCENNVSKKSLKSIIERVESFFSSSTKKDYFDYAVFPFLIKDN